MIFSANFGTSIHILLIISEYSKSQKVTSEFIANILGTHPVLTRNLLGTLKKAGFVTIAPTNEKSGTQITLPLEAITLCDILEAVEPNFLNDICEPSTKFSNRTHAGKRVNEIISGYVANSLDVLKEDLKKTTLADTLATMKKMNTKYSHGD